VGEPNGVVLSAAAKTHHCLSVLSDKFQFLEQCPTAFSCICSEKVHNPLPSGRGFAIDDCGRNEPGETQWFVDYRRTEGSSLPAGATPLSRRASAGN